MNKWHQYLEIKRHPFLDRFESRGAILAMYEEACYGVPTMLLGRPTYWYERARSTDDAIERFGEMASARLDYHHGMKADLMQALEDCEEPGSIDLIEKIMAFYPTSPFGPPAHTWNYAIHDPATEGQRNFLKRLGIRNFTGTKNEASKKIDAILKERELTK